MFLVFIILLLFGSYRMSVMLLPMLNGLYFHLRSIQSICAVHDVLVLCNSLISCFPGMLLRCFLNDYEMVPVTSIITDITVVLLLFFYYYWRVVNDSEEYCRVLSQH